MKTDFLKKHIPVLSTLVLALNFTVCETDAEDGAKSMQNSGTGQVLIRVGMGAARTVMPYWKGGVGLGDISKYVITLSKTGSEPITFGDDADEDTSKITGAGIEFDLTPGTWTVKVDAYREINGAEYKAASGTESLVVTARESKTVYVTLNPIPISGGGSGVFAWNLKLPAGVTLTTFTFNGSDLSGKALTDSIETAAGIYPLIIVLTKADTKQTAGLYETVYIYPGLESKAIYDFTSSDYKLEFADKVMIQGTLNITRIGPADSDLKYTLKAYSDAACTNAITGATTTIEEAPEGAISAVQYLIGIPAEVYTGLTAKNVYIKATADSTIYAEYSYPVITVSSIGIAGKTGVEVNIVTGIKSFTTELYKTSVSPANKTGESSLAGALDYIGSAAVSGDNYILVFKANENIAPIELYSSGSAIGITLQGNSIISLSPPPAGSMFTIESGVTLTLGGNITLEGQSGNTASLIMVNSGATFVMESGVKISGNTAYYGGGI